MYKFHNISPMRSILLGYCLIILIGALLLTLPISSYDKIYTPFIDALLTSTSAVCVTGLIVFDTYTYWSIFGQIVILCLIQIGGIGFMTIAIGLYTFTKKKIGLSQRFTMQESIAAPQLGGIVKFTKFILFTSFIIEIIGAFFLSFYFCPKIGFIKGIYFSIFHSVSALCNAGFDLIGYIQPFSSLVSFYNNIYINIIIIILIIIGGLGFFVWFDLLECRFRFSKAKLHTKLVLVINLALILIGTMGIFILESKWSLKDFSFLEKLLSSLFQTVSTRTAGFNTVDLSTMTESGLFLMIILMVIGGSPGSTAGGIKTTTFAVLIISIFTKYHKKKSMECFNRKLADDLAITASCIFTIYIILVTISSITISSIENTSILTSLFECISAISTVGFSLGLTPNLSSVSKFILINLMIFGRVGFITFLFAISSDKSRSTSKWPLEKIRIG